MSDKEKKSTKAERSAPLLVEKVEKVEKVVKSECRRRCGLCGLVIVVVVALGAWALCRCCRVADRRQCHCGDTIKHLEKDVQRLQEQMEAVVARQNSERCFNCTGQLRQRWKTWMALLGRIQSTSQLDDELQKFRKSFEDDKETLRLVEDYLRYVGYNSGAVTGGPLESCRKFLKKIVRFKRANGAKVMEICGHVLSSSGGK
ncbi:MAG: hypothetical protein LBB63_00195 [Holosporaceae bacterium]|jgi:hypothetical protein|nr:hypothetical protein [Holosporaceae bacterium]